MRGFIWTMVIEVETLPIFLICANFLSNRQYAPVAPIFRRRNYY